jgi:hypothetical protein
MLVSCKRTNILGINQLPVSATKWQHKSPIANNSETTEAREKIIIDLDSLEFYN